MAIIAKLIVERFEKPYHNDYFFGDVKKSQKIEEITEFEKVENVRLPKFDKVQVVFNDGENCSYRVTIDKHLFDYNDASNSFECTFTNTCGNIFELDIFNDEITLKHFHSRSEYDENNYFQVEDVIAFLTFKRDLDYGKGRRSICYI